MTMRTIPLLALAALAGCTPPPPAAVQAPAPVADDSDAACALAVRFGSYAMGIDREALGAVETILAGTPYTVRRWGREGEVTLCATPVDGARADALFDAIRARLPARPRGPIQLTTRAGRTFDAPAH